MKGSGKCSIRPALLADSTHSSGTSSSEQPKQSFDLGNLYNPFLMEHYDNPIVINERQIMVDVDSTLFPLLDAMRKCPGGERVSIEKCHAWSDLSGLVEGGSSRMIQIFDECMNYQSMQEHKPYPSSVATLQSIHKHGDEPPQLLKLGFLGIL
jgi:hypothetical protein